MDPAQERLVGDTMICLEVSRNGEVICTAGVAEGFVILQLMQFGIADNSGCQLRLTGVEHKPATTGPDLALKLRAALQHPERPPSMHSVRWLTDDCIKLGDEITIKVVDRTESDPPSRPAENN